MAKQERGQKFAPLGDFKESAAPEPEKVKPKSGKGGKGGERRPNIFKRIGRYFKEMWSELKKVTWPKVPKVFKQTGVVLVVVLVFLLVLIGIDYLFSVLLGLLTNTGA